MEYIGLTKSCKKKIETSDFTSLYRLTRIFRSRGREIKVKRSKMSSAEREREGGELRGCYGLAEREKKKTIAR